jgi:hypothetical protein
LPISFEFSDIQIKIFEEIKYMNKKVAIFAIVFTLLFSLSNFEVIAASKAPTIQQLQKKITELTKQMKSLTSNIAKRDKENNSLKARLATTSKELNTIKSDNITLQNQINAKDNKILEQNKIIEELNKKVKAAELLSKASVTYTDSEGNPISKDSVGSVIWYGFKTDMTTIYFTESSYKEFNYILDVSDELVRDVAGYFGVQKLSSDVPVYIAFKENIFPKTEYADYRPHKKDIVIKGGMFAPYNHNNNENLVGVYSHEFAHAFQYQFLYYGETRHKFNNSDLRSLFEGMSNFIPHQYLDFKKYTLPANQITMPYNRGNYDYSRQIKDSYEYFKISASNLKTISDDSFFRGTPPAESMVYYIETKYGREKFFDFIKGLRTLSINDSMVKNFGVTETQFIQDWKIYYSLS